MSSPSKRREMDVMKLMMSDYSAETMNDGLNEFNVEFHGPKESHYEGGVWKIRVELPDAYPYKSPSIGFVNKIFHPNVDEFTTGKILESIESQQPAIHRSVNEIMADSPLYISSTADLALYAWMSLTNHGVQYLLNVFEVFLPQLLLYPNASDPLNGDAASSMMKDKKLYDQKVREYCEQYAKKENVTNSRADKDSEEEDMSEEESGSSDDDDIADHADP